MTKYMRISSILGSPSSYMTLQRLYSEFPIYEENFLFFFISVFQLEGRGEKHTVLEFYNNLWGLGTEQEYGSRTGYIGATTL